MKIVTTIQMLLVLWLAGRADISFAQSIETLNQGDSSQVSDAYSNLSGLTVDSFHQGIADTITIFSPLNWDRSVYLKTALISSVAVGLYSYDEKINRWAQDNRSGPGDSFAAVSIRFGDIKYVVPSLAISYIAGDLWDNPHIQRTSLLSMESLVISNLFAGTLKLSGGRHRPNKTASRSTWDGPGLSTSNDSFPSAHSASAFAVATVIASEYGDVAFVTPLAYTMATLTALSRVNDNVHWSSDVFVGSAIGYFIGRSVIELNKEDSSIVMLPVVQQDYRALQLTYYF